MPSVSQREFDAILRYDLTAFTEKVFATVNPGVVYVPNWHVEAQMEALRKLYKRELRYLLTTMPPRHGKSIMTSVALPAYVLGHDPSHRFMVVSYGSTLAAKHARDFRQVVHSEWYQRIFPDTMRNVRKDTELEFETAAGGGRFAGSLNGTITGFGARTLIIDDLMNASDAGSATERKRVKDFYDQAFFSRLDNKADAAVVAIQQRLHQDDLAAHLIEKGLFTHLNMRAIAREDEVWDLGGGRWKRRAIGEALWEAAEPLEVLEDIRKSMGDPTYYSQWHQDPTLVGDSPIHWEKEQFCDEAPPLELLRYKVQSWDVAVTTKPESDYSVCTTWGYLEPNWYLLDLWRDKLEFPELLAAARGLRQRWKPDAVLAEKVGVGYPFFQALRRDRQDETPTRDYAPWSLFDYTPKVDKDVRLSAASLQFEWEQSSAQIRPHGGDQTRTRRLPQRHA